MKILLLIALSSNKGSGESAHMRTHHSIRCSRTQSIGVDTQANI